MSQSFKINVSLYIHFRTIIFMVSVLQNVVKIIEVFLEYIEVRYGLLLKFLIHFSR